MMLGIAHHSPYVIQVYLNRRKFHDYVVKATDVTGEAWHESFQRFVDSNDGRDALVLVDTVAALRVLVEQMDLSSVKVLVFDTDVELRAAGISIIDETRRADGNYGMWRISIQDVNTRCANMACGADLPPPPKIKPTEPARSEPQVEPKPEPQAAPTKARAKKKKDSVDEVKNYELF